MDEAAALLARRLKHVEQGRKDQGKFAATSVAGGRDPIPLQHIPLQHRNNDMLDLMFSAVDPGIFGSSEDSEDSEDEEDDYFYPSPHHAAVVRPQQTNVSFTGAGSAADPIAL